MAKKIMQYRFYGDDNSKNYPDLITSSKLISGTAFEDNFPITQLGIQTLPGTKFYLNEGNTPIIIGSTGIYELDLEGLTEINNLSFDARSLKRINEVDSAYLIIDMICGEKE